MKRETVKELLSLSDETLKFIGFNGFVVHREVAEYYANGGDVEFYDDGEYRPISNLFFYPNLSCRKALPEIKVFGVKVRCNPPETEPLEKGETYYYLDMERENMCSSRYWANAYLLDSILLKNKVIWRDESDIKAVVKALRGEK